MTVLSHCEAVIMSFRLNPLAPPPSVVATTSDFVLPDVTLVSPGAGRLPNQDVHIANGRIEGVRTASSSASPELQALRGRFVLPGLVDMHTHLPTANALQLSGYFALLYLAHGVTTLREAGDMDGSAVRTLSDAVDRGDYPAPRVFSCGPFIGGAPARLENTIVVTAPGDAAAAVRKVKQAGHHFVKSYDYLTVPQLNELKAAAREHQLPVMGHVPFALPYEEALVPEVQHLYGVPEPHSVGADHILNRSADWQDVDSARLDRIVEATLEHGIGNTPTLAVTANLLRYADYRGTLQHPDVQLMPRMYREVVWHPDKGIPFLRGVVGFLDRLQDALDRKRRLVKRLHEVGARLHIGTDCPLPFTVPGASVHQEMQQFCEAGIDLEEVWRLATTGAAEMLPLKQLGTLEPSAPADLLVFREDPMVSWSAMQSLEAVVAQGRLYLCRDIEAAIQRYKRHFDGLIFDQVSLFASRRIMARLVKTAS